MKVSSIPPLPGVTEVGEKVRWMGRSSFDAFKAFFEGQGYLIDSVKCRYQHRPVYRLRQNEEPVMIKLLADGDAELMGNDFIFVLKEKEEE